ncbi:MAG TPA: LamG domain-containing protein [Polyangiaceae bacterium]|nr:LamG domain-containing protein [Polyangiaceae bacterium]
MIVSPTGTTVIGPDGTNMLVDAGAGGSIAASPDAGGPTGDATPGDDGGGGSGSSGSGSGGTGSSDSGPSGGSSSGGVGNDGGFTLDGGESGSFGQWHFDDCSPKSTVLLDSGGGPNAQHALRGSCVPGISGLGVSIRAPRDVVEVPNAPEFAVGSRVAVAAWVFPNSVTGDQPIVIKRLNDKTSFSLGVHKKNIEMSVVSSDGTTYISQAPIAAGTWTHVAGMFDGTFVYLFINGQQFGQIYAAGTLRDVNAPVRIGATTQSQSFDGIIDEVFLSTQAITKDTLTALACIHRPTTVAVTPTSSGPVPAGTSVHYDFKISDNDVGSCSTDSYDLFVQSPDPAIIPSNPNGFQPATPGSTIDIGLDVSSSDDADPGTSRCPGKS